MLLLIDCVCIEVHCSNYAFLVKFNIWLYNMSILSTYTIGWLPVLYFQFSKFVACISSMRIQFRFLKEDQITKLGDNGSQFSSVRNLLLSPAASLTPAHNIFMRYAFHYVFQELASRDMDRHAPCDHHLRHGKLGLLRCRVQNRDGIKSCCRSRKYNFYSSPLLIG